MSDLGSIREAIQQVDSVQSAASFFQELGYPVILPLPDRLQELPRGARQGIDRIHLLAELGNGSPLRIFHVEVRAATIRRTDVRRLLEAFYRHYPQGENLFVFAPSSHEEIVFVSPRRLPDPRKPGKVRLWLRILPVDRQRPCRTDLEVLDRIRADGIRDPQELWRRHEEAFSVQRVTEQFFRDYAEVFEKIRNRLSRTHRRHDNAWSREYAHQLLNRIMFLYFIARKGWLLGPDGSPDRHFMRHFWEAYRDAQEAGRAGRDTFHSEWLPVLFFEAFNNRWKNRREYMRRFPEWLRRSLALAPFLNGGLYTERHNLDGLLKKPLPDEIFELLFDKWTDGTFPGLFERYNFTVVESGRFDEQVAVDPEMLGMVYERLVNISYESGEDDLRSAAGIFYTPRTEIDLMCRLSLVDWLGNHLGPQHKSLLYEWVFAFTEEEKEHADAAVMKARLWARLDELVRQVRVCDPACGSGAFLVGMLLVLDDLQARCNAARGVQESPYERRKRILQDQLYGVDVMEWAVRVAELRLWLQLVVETDIPESERKSTPLLPNLDLKLRPGDSLVQTVGGFDLSPFRRAEFSLPGALKRRITQLKRKKQRFFRGQNRELAEDMLRQEELTLFRDILAAKVHELGEQLKKARRHLDSIGAQRGLPGMEAADRASEIAARERLEAGIQELTAQRERYEQALRSLRPDQPPPFVWDLAFVEIFADENPGFDIVIGNPPYVRQEQIRDYLERFNRSTYLNRLNDGLRAIYPGFMGPTRRISGRADYYVYFCLHALSLVAKGGSFCFITSNSWLDVKFGTVLQEFFLRHGHLKMVIDNRAKRSFAQADVNTVIVLAGQPQRRTPLTEDEMKQRRVRFVAFRVPFEEAISPVVFSEIEDEALYQPLAGFRVLKRPEYRSVLWDQHALYLDGTAADPGRRIGLPPYEGNKWGGKYLRAPDIYFTILEKGKGKFVRLGDIARVRRGFTTGANDFFYLEPVGRTVKDVAELREKNPMVPVRVKNEAGWEGEIEAAWLRPAIKSPREIRTLRVRLDDLRYVAFMPPPDVREAIDERKSSALSRYPKAAAYIRWGKRHGYSDGSTCSSRPCWWDLGQRATADVVWPMIHNDRLVLAIHDQSVVADHNLFEITSPHGVSLVFSLSATYQAMVRELVGRVNLGQGAIKTDGVDIKRLITVTPACLPFSAQRRLRSALDRLENRPVRSIFEELGFTLCPVRRCDHSEHPYEHVKAETLTLEQVCRTSPDRYELDCVIFDVLGLTDEERLAVYRAVVELVKDRLVKARSVKQRS